MSSNWWANKLGTNPTQQRQQPVYTPPIPVQATPQIVQTPSARCPNCASANYVGTAETRSRCYDCGYPIVQQGSGTPGIRTAGGSGPATPAKQVATNGYNPNVIVDRIN
jgi:hypothetical protein